MSRRHLVGRGQPRERRDPGEARRHRRISRPYPTLDPGPSVVDGLVDQRAQLGPERVGDGREQLGHEDGEEVLDGVDPEGRVAARPSRTRRPSRPWRSRPVRGRRRSRGRSPTPSKLASPKPPRATSWRVAPPGSWFAVISSSVLRPGTAPSLPVGRRPPACDRKPHSRVWSRRAAGTGEVRARPHVMPLANGPSIRRGAVGGAVLVAGGQAGQGLFGHEETRVSHAEGLEHPARRGTRRSAAPTGSRPAAPRCGRDPVFQCVPGVELERVLGGQGGHALEGLSRIQRPARAWANYGVDRVVREQAARQPRRVHQTRRACSWAAPA